MNYFPAFLKLDGSRILIVGGGKIATEKIEKLLDFTTSIEVIAPEISADMQRYIEAFGLRSYQREYIDGDALKYDIVIIAVDDLELQRRIYEETRKSRVLCNAVDSVDYCDFIFPSYLKEGDLTIAVSTSGASPAVAKHLRRYLQSILPEGIAAFLEEMKALRTRLPKGKERMQMLDKKAREFFNKKRGE